MIKQAHIQNFKSIYDLEIEVGRINLFIGENGSGKSNLLEAFVFVSASESNKLDNEFLISRGLRVTKPILMRSAFKQKDQNRDIKIDIVYDESRLIEYKFHNENTTYSPWVREFEDKVLIEKNLMEDLEIYKKKSAEINNEFRSYEEKVKDNNDELTKELLDTAKQLLEKYKELTKYDYLEKDLSQLKSKFDLDIKLKDFLIFSPENTMLRRFYEEGQIEPLGINGEGLLKLLKVINNYDDKSYINTIIESLKSFNWFDGIDNSSLNATEEETFQIKDKYLCQEIDHSSTNEGFLFILFYVTLVVAKETPKSFAIDNIDASLNPKLCTKLMTILSDLAKKYDKQIFLTTHNPAILDGFDLNDEEQKLFVVSRNEDGYTQINNITMKDNPVDEDGERLHLSEAFLRGYLGGLPREF